MIHVLSLSYGKDSIACLYALREMGWPLERIIHADVWATDYIPADLPEMVNFKKYADKKIKDEFGIDVEHVCAKDKNGEKLTYEKIFYTARKFARKENKMHQIYGWPFQKGPWCNDRLKISALKLDSSKYIQYLGIAYDEPKRYKVLVNNKISPLVINKWTEQQCYDVCKKIICYRLSIHHHKEVAAGFATIKVLISCDCSEKTIRVCGIKIHLSHLEQTAINYLSMIDGSG